MSNHTENAQILHEVFETILSRKQASAEESYVASLLSKGNNAILKKIGEEASEVIIAAKENQPGELIHELVDLWFHSLVLMAHHDLTLEQIYDEFQSRFGVSGIIEKAARSSKK